MVSKIIQFVIVFALISLAINIFPKVYVWAVEFINWVMSFGKWGVIALVTCIAIAIIDGLR
jgi:hypothetical protein